MLFMHHRRKQKAKHFELFFHHRAKKETLMHRRKAFGRFFSEFVFGSETEPRRLETANVSLARERENWGYRIKKAKGGLGFGGFIGTNTHHFHHNMTR